MRRVSLGIVAVTSTAAALALQPVIAQADTPPPVGVVSAPVPYPAPGVVDAGGGSSCPAGPQLIDPIWYNARIGTALDGSPTVEDVAGVNTGNAGCGDSVTFYLQVKVCPWYMSCRWDDIAQVTYTDLPINGQLISTVLSAPLRGGTNRYRMRAEITTYSIDAETEGDGLSIIGVVPDVEEKAAPNGVQLTHS